MHPLAAIFLTFGAIGLLMGVILLGWSLLLSRIEHDRRIIRRLNESATPPQQQARRLV